MEKGPQNNPSRSTCDHLCTSIKPMYRVAQNTAAAAAMQSRAGEGEGAESTVVVVTTHVAAASL